MYNYQFLTAHRILHIIVASKLLKPLAVFVNQPESQPYIKSIRNLDGINPTETDKNTIIVETISDFTLTITYNQEDNSITSVETSIPEQQPTTTDPRHYRMFADYGAEFIWWDVDDMRPEEDETYLDPDGFFASFPPSMREHYDAWGGTYNNYFTARLWNPADFGAPLWHSAEEQVAWYVGGFLLGWRFALDPQVGSVKYLDGTLLERGKDMSVTLEFLKNQVYLLANWKYSRLVLRQYLGIKGVLLNRCFSIMSIV